MTSKLKIFIITILSVLLTSFTLIVIANFDKVEIGKTITISIGNWDSNTTITIPGFNIDEWIKNDTLDQLIEEGQYFSYNGYIYISNGSYNPAYNGLPEQGSNYWAYVSTELEWRPNTNYRPNSVVIRDDRYFIANIEFNTDNWFIDDPLTNNGRWKPWREIEPISNENFSMIEEFNIINYADPDFNYIIYK